MIDEGLPNYIIALRTGYHRKSIDKIRKKRIEIVKSLTAEAQGNLG